jgi:CPA2 family monovalent cation:H+ antiporter-2/glutathione-regulated potassium-efflux system ancillary protein KefC
MPELYKIHREDEERYISMYQKHNADLEELMKMDLEADMDDLDKAWRVGKPES